RHAGVQFIYKEDPTVHQQVILRNPTQTIIPNVVYHDVLYGIDGAPLRDEVWELGDIMPKEEIELTYDMEFSIDAPFGRYKVVSVVETTGSSPAIQHNGLIWLLEHPLLQVPEADFSPYNLSEPSSVL